MLFTIGTEKDHRRVFEKHIQRSREQRRAFYDRLGRVIVEAHEKVQEAPRIAQERNRQRRLDSFSFRGFSRARESR